VVLINNPWGLLYYEKSPFVVDDDEVQCCPVPMLPTIRVSNVLRVQTNDSEDELTMRMQKRAKLLAKKVLIKDMDGHHEEQRRPLAFIDLTNGTAHRLSLSLSRGAPCP
jgi:hypothetical protein